MIQTESPSPPITATIAEARRLSGLGKTSLFGLIADGSIRAKKFGRSTLVVVDSLRAYLDALPDAGQER